MESNQTKLDRRIRRTQQIIEDAFLSICLERDFGDIIVKDITERANVNRSTFYAHYQDKYELLDKIVNEKLSTLGKLANHQTSGWNGNHFDFNTPDPFFVAFFEHVSANDTFYRIILTKMHAFSFPDKMLEVIRDCFYIRISNFSKDQKLLVPLDILLDNISASMLGTTKKWLEQQMIYTPRYMALQLTRLSMLGLYRAMGVNGI
jgi:hypothetical protein